MAVKLTTQTMDKVSNPEYMNKPKKILTTTLSTHLSFEAQTVENMKCMIGLVFKRDKINSRSVELILE